MGFIFAVGYVIISLQVNMCRSKTVYTENAGLVELINMSRVGDY